MDETKQKADSQCKELTEVRKELAHSEKQLSNLKVELLVAQKGNKASEERIKQLQVSYLRHMLYNNKGNISETFN